MLTRSAAMYSAVAPRIPATVSVCSYTWEATRLKAIVAIHPAHQRLNVPLVSVPQLPSASNLALASSLVEHPGVQPYPAEPDDEDNSGGEQRECLE